jgi:hypothetical protein
MWVGAAQPGAGTASAIWKHKPLLLLRAMQEARPEGTLICRVQWTSNVLKSRT